MQAHDPIKAEHYSLIIDSGLGDIWIAIMGLSPMPALIITAVLVSDRYAAGGWKLLRLALLALCIVFWITWSFLGYPLNLTFSHRTVWLSLPLAPHLYGWTQCYFSAFICSSQ